MEADNVWDNDRLALLGYLIGTGRAVAQVAEDMGTTSGNVYRQAARFGLSFRSSPDIAMAPHTYKALRAAAARRGVDTATLVNLVLRLLGNDVTLLENCIDDDFSHEYFAGVM